MSSRLLFRKRRVGACLLLSVAALAGVLSASPLSAAGATGAGSAAAIGLSGDSANQRFAAPSTKASIDIGTAVSIALTAPGSSTPELVPFNLLVITNWPTQEATEPDPTTIPTNKITLRTEFLIHAVTARRLETLKKMGCVANRPANPESDHPLGRACDLSFDHTTPAGVAAGWRTANWLVANQAVLGVKYVIWQGLIWIANKRPGPWITYISTAYGCPNPANITGCHYDHVHVSMY